MPKITKEDILDEELLKLIPLLSNIDAFELLAKYMYHVLEEEHIDYTEMFPQSRHRVDRVNFTDDEMELLLQISKGNKERFNG